MEKTTYFYFNNIKSIFIIMIVNITNNLLFYCEYTCIFSK